MAMNFTQKVLRKLMHKFGGWIPDRPYLQLLYLITMKTRLHLDNPVTMNEKLQWLKLYNRKPEYHDLVDKLKVKEIMVERLGSDHIIPTLAVWDKVDDIDITSLPDSFVLKTTHSGGNMGVAICSDKSNFNLKKAKSSLAKSMRAKGIDKIHREWPYKGMKRRIIAEKYIVDNDGALNDYKFFCFNGNVDSVLICIDRQINAPKFYFFDKDWNLKRYNIRGKAAPQDFTLPKPKNIDKMFEMAAKLSEGFPFIRVDLYNVDGAIFFGEMTFFPDSGFDSNILPDIDEYFGSLIHLNK